MQKPHATPVPRHRSDGYGAVVGRIATNVRRLREVKGWTQEEAAAKCDGLAPRLYRQIESAGGNLTVSTLARLAEGFGVDVSALLSPAPPPTRRPRGRPPKPLRLYPNDRTADENMYLTDPLHGPAEASSPVEFERVLTLAQRAKSPAHAKPPVAKDPDMQRRTSALVDRSQPADDRTESTGAHDAVTRAAHLLEQVREVRGQLHERRAELSAEAQQVAAALLALEEKPPPAVPSEPNVMKAPRVRAATIVIPNYRRENLREFLVALFDLNPQGLLTTEMEEAARSAGMRPRKNVVHTLVHAMYEAGFLSREGRRGSYIYRLRGGPGDTSTER